MLPSRRQQEEILLSSGPLPDWQSETWRSSDGPMNEGSIKFTALVVEDDPGALHRNGDAGSAIPVAA